MESATATEAAAKNATKTTKITTTATIPYKISAPLNRRMIRAEVLPGKWLYCGETATHLAGVQGLVITYIEAVTSYMNTVHFTRPIHSFIATAHIAFSTILKTRGSQTRIFISD